MILLAIVALSLTQIVNCDQSGAQSTSMDITAINSLVRRPQIHLDPRLRKALLRVLTRLDQEDTIESSSDKYQVVTQEDLMAFFQKERQDPQLQRDQEQEPVMTEVLPTPQNPNAKLGKSLVDEKIFKSENSLKNINVFGLKTHQPSINEIPTTDHVKNGFFFRVPLVSNDTSTQNATAAETFSSEESQNIHEANFKNSLTSTLNIPHAQNSHVNAQNSHDTPFRNSLKNALKSPETFMNMHSHLHVQNSQETNFKNILDAENINNLRNNQNSHEVTFKNNFENIQNGHESNVKSSFENIQNSHEPNFKNSFENTQNSHETNLKTGFENAQNSQEANFKNSFTNVQRPELIETTKTSFVIAEENQSRNTQEERVIAQEIQRPQEVQENKHSREVENASQNSKEEANNVGKEETDEEDKEDKQEKEGGLEENASRSNGTDNPELKLEGKVEFSEAPLVVAFTVQQDSRGHPHRVIPLSYRGEAGPSPQVSQAPQSSETEEPKATQATKVPESAEVSFYKPVAQSPALFQQNPSLSSSQPFVSVDRPFTPSNDLSRVNTPQFVKTQAEIIPSQNFFPTQQALQPIANPQQSLQLVNNQQHFVAPLINVQPTAPQPVTTFDFVPSVVKQDGFVPFQPHKQNFFEPKFQQNFIGSNDLSQPLRSTQQSFFGGNDYRHNPQNFITTNDLVPPARSHFDDRRRFPVRSQSFDFQRSVDVPPSNFFQRRPHPQNFFPQQQQIQPQPQPLIELNRVNRKEPNQFVGNFGFNPQQRYNNYNSQYQFQQAVPVPLDNQLRHLFYQSGIENPQRFGGGGEDLNIVSKVLALNHVGRNDLSEQSFSETSRNVVKIRPPSRVIEPPFE